MIELKINHKHVQYDSKSNLQRLVLEIVEELVEGGNVGAHLNSKILKPVNRHQVNDNGKSEKNYNSRKLSFVQTSVSQPFLIRSTLHWI